MFYAGFDLLFSILFPILFLVVLGMILCAINGMLVEGDIGKLSFQGNRYLGFERN